VTAGCDGSTCRAQDHGYWVDDPASATEAVTVTLCRKGDAVVEALY